MAPTDPAIKKAKVKEKPYKLADEKGLCLFVKPNGGKLWRFKYGSGGKEKLLAHRAFQSRIFRSTIRRSIDGLERCRSCQRLQVQTLRRLPR